MEPATIAALAVGGATLLGSGGQAYAQGKMNKKTREWNEKMFQRQNETNEAYWHMQNAYNSPRAQMQRLQEAGLNPMLAYGNSGSGASGMAGDLSSGSAPSWHPDTPKFDVQSGIMAYNNFREQSVRIDNMQKQAELMDAEIANKNANTYSTLATGDDTLFTLHQKDRLKDISFDAAELSLRKTQTDIDATRTGTEIALRADERAAIQQDYSLTESIERVLTMRADRAKTGLERAKILKEIDLLKQDEEYKELDLQYRRQGIDPKDPIYWRAVSRAVNHFGLNFDNAGQKLKGMRDYIEKNSDKLFPIQGLIRKYMGK